MYVYESKYKGTDTKTNIKGRWENKGISSKATEMSHKIQFKYC